MKPWTVSSDDHKKGKHIKITIFRLNKTNIVAPWNIRIKLNANFYRKSITKQESSELRPASLLTGICHSFRGTKKIKFYAQINCQLVYISMPLWNGICQYERKCTALKKHICQWTGPSPSAISETKIHSTEKFANWWTATLWTFISESVLDDGRTVTVPRGFSRIYRKG